MKYLILYSLLVLSFFKLFAQNTITSDEHAKYWYYKKKLTDNFVNFGIQDPVNCDSSGGQSILASRFNYIDTSVGTKLLSYDEDNLMWFGQYLGVLATEYKLLNDNGENTEEVELDFYKAMMVYERLDRKSGILK